MGNREYLMQGGMVLLVLALTFVGILYYAKRASKRKNRPDEK